MGKVGLLPESLRKYPHEFSGGQRQRIAIAVEPKFRGKTHIRSHRSDVFGQNR